MNFIDRESKLMHQQGGCLSEHSSLRTLEFSDRTDSACRSLVRVMGAMEETLAG